MTSVKRHTVANMYETASSIASDTKNKEYSERMVDELLVNNSYSKKVLDQIKSQSKKKAKKKNKQNSNEKQTVFKIPHLSDKCTSMIKEAVKKHNLPIRVVTTPGVKLKNLLTSSKPLDKIQCPNDDCKTCSSLTSKGQCTDRNVIYHMKCEMATCKSNKIGQYDGETYRPLNDRFIEHLRSANNPKAKSYIDKPWAKHYANKHPECDEPKISIAITDRASSTNERKIKEARTIIKNRSDLNACDEQLELQRFLV